MTEFNYQVTYAPRCPECGSANTAIRRSQGMVINHEGARCRAQRQLRTCRECESNFGTMHIKGVLQRKTTLQ